MVVAAMMVALLAMLLPVRAAALSAGDSARDCNYSIDNPTDARHGHVRAGADFACLEMSANATVDSCAAACCSAAGHRCKAFSYNAPWTLPKPYMAGCTLGRNCCCLKDAAPPPEPNKWQMNITSGLVTPPPPPLCIAPGVCCSLNGRIAGDGLRCECFAGWRGDDCGELDLLPVHDIGGAYQTKGVDLADCATSCGPSSWGGLPLRGPDGKYHLCDILMATAILDRLSCTIVRRARVVEVWCFNGPSEQVPPVCFAVRGQLHARRMEPRFHGGSRDS